MRPSLAPAAIAGLLAFSGIAVLPTVASEGPPSMSKPTSQASGAPSVAAGTTATQRSSILRTFVPLAAAGTPVHQTVQAFLDRAEVASVDEHELIRTRIAATSSNAEVANELATTVFDTRERDYTRTLTALSVLGELRHPAGTIALTKFIALPLPTTGHTVDGEISERATLERLQMKAIDGLAYAGSADGDRAVLAAASSNPSRAVRAEAIDAYLYNHPAADARAKLLAAVRPEDRIFLERPTMSSATTAGEFNAKLESFLSNHPELQPPAVAGLAEKTALMKTYEASKDARVPVLRQRVEPPAFGAR